MNKKARNLVENGGGTVVAAASGPGAVVAVAGGATNAAAMTSALATLGGGTMLAGFGTVAVLGAVGFFGGRWLIRKVTRRTVPR